MRAAVIAEKIRWHAKNVLKSDDEMIDRGDVPQEYFDGPVVRRPYVHVPSPAVSEMIERFKAEAAASANRPADDYRYYEYREERRMQEARSDAFRSSGFGRRHTEMVGQCVFPDQRRARSMMRLVLGGESLVMLGPRGTGKTQLACCIAHRWAQERMSNVKYLRLYDYFAALKASYDDNGPDETRTEAMYARAGLLIIDECHERVASDWEGLMFSRLIDKRYSNMAVTIFIGNVMPDAFRQLVGESISSRLQETATTEVIDWGSFRDRPKLAG